MLWPNIAIGPFSWPLFFCWWQYISHCSWNLKYNAILPARAYYYLPQSRFNSTICMLNLAWATSCPFVPSRLLLSLSYLLCFTRMPPSEQRLCPLLHDRNKNRNYLQHTHISVRRLLNLKPSCHISDFQALVFALMRERFTLWFIYLQIGNMEIIETPTVERRNDQVAHDVVTVHGGERFQWLTGELLLRQGSWHLSL